MTEWRVSLNGQNFWLELQGAPKRLGFYTTRYVEAPNAEAAENAAVQMLREDETLQRVLNDRTDPPVIYAEELSEAVDRDPAYGNSGFTFYPEEDDS